MEAVLLELLEKLGQGTYPAVVRRVYEEGHTIGLPTTLATSESDGGLGMKIVFERHIVYPNGHREIEGVTPKQLPAPASHVLPGSSGHKSDDSNDKSGT